MKKFIGRVFITGGAGTLGHAIAERVRADGNTAQLTIFSRDPLKHQAMRRKYPEHTYITGDVLDLRALTLAVAGHDLILHAAAQKHIPEAEHAPTDCYRSNVDGTLNVVHAAIAANVQQVLAISTDKACQPVNAYGCSKLMMERALQQIALEVKTPRINLCRYGNVLNSNGSVLRAWKQARERGDKCAITHRDMTRFWISEAQAVDLILYALSEPSGSITIPMLPALSMLALLRYTQGDNAAHTVIGIRPGEKLHEELITRYEYPYTMKTPDGYTRLYPVTGVPNSDVPEHGYTSDIARTLTREELAAML